MRSGSRSLIIALILIPPLWILLRRLLPLFLPFLLGGALALAAEPLVRLLQRLFRLPRFPAAVVAISAAFSAIALLGLLLCAFLLRELGLLASVLPELAETAGSGILLLRDRLLDLSGRAPENLRPLLERNVTDLFSGGTALLDRGLSYMLSLAGNLLKYLPDSALGLGTTVISGFLISARLPRFGNWFQLRREKLRPLLETLARLRSGLGGWVTAQCKLAAVTFLLLLGGLLLLRISHAPLWAAGITLLDALPVLGTGTALLPWALVCQLRGEGARALGLSGLYAVITLTRSFLEPKLVGKALGLDPLAALMALYAGYRLWGITGMLLAPALLVTVLQLLPPKKQRDP